MTKRMTVWSTVGVLLGAILLPAANAQPRGGPGMGMGRGMGMRGRGRGGFDREAMRKRMEAIRMVDSYWLALTFGVKVKNEKLLALRSDFQKAWDARKAARDQIKPGDFQTALKAIEDANAQLDEALKAKLTDAEYKKMKEVAQTMHPGPRGGRGGPGRGGRGGGRPGWGPGGPGGPPPGGAGPGGPPAPPQ